MGQIHDNLLGICQNYKVDDIHMTKRILNNKLHGVEHYLAEELYLLWGLRGVYYLFCSVIYLGVYIYALSSGV